MWRDPTELDAALSGVDVVLHCAGINRAPTDSALALNSSLARDLTTALDRADLRPLVVFANSIQSGNDTAFGKAKEEAAEHLAEWARRTGASFVDFRLPNLFGEHGKPHYNSVVATFSHQLATGETPTVLEDRLIPLLHVQDALDDVLAAIAEGASGVLEPEGTPIKVSALLAKLQNFAELYRRGDIPDISNAFDRALFNTYRSFCFPDKYPFTADLKADARGSLFECVRGHGGRSQVFCSWTEPGATRGNHFHLRKVERFIVLRGEATISLRRLFDQAIVRFHVTGRVPSMVDMPTMWTHSITNTGADELTTLFWADEIPEGGSSDTYGEPVDLSGTPA